jgi:hypothetical protein
MPLICPCSDCTSIPPQSRGSSRIDSGAATLGGCLSIYDTRGVWLVRTDSSKRQQRIERCDGADASAYELWWPCTYRPAKLLGLTGGRPSGAYVCVRRRFQVDTGLGRYDVRSDTPAGLALGVTTLPWVHAALLLGATTRGNSLADDEDARAYQCLTHTSACACSGASLFAPTRLPAHAMCIVHLGLLCSLPAADASSVLSLWSTLASGLTIVVVLSVTSSSVATRVPLAAAAAAAAVAMGAAPGVCHAAAAALAAQAALHVGVAHMAARYLPRTFTAGEAVLVSSTPLAHPRRSLPMLNVAKGSKKGVRARGCSWSGASERLMRPISCTAIN